MRRHEFEGIDALVEEYRPGFHRVPLVYQVPLPNIGTPLRLNHMPREICELIVSLKKLYADGESESLTVHMPPSSPEIICSGSFHIELIRGGSGPDRGRCDITPPRRKRIIVYIDQRLQYPPLGLDADMRIRRLIDAEFSCAARRPEDHRHIRQRIPVIVPDQHSNGIRRRQLLCHRSVGHAQWMYRLDARDRGQFTRDFERIDVVVPQTLKLGEQESRIVFTALDEAMPELYVPSIEKRETGGRPPTPAQIYVHVEFIEILIAHVDDDGNGIAGFWIRPDTPEIVLGPVEFRQHPHPRDPCEFKQEDQPPRRPDEDQVTVGRQRGIVGQNDQTAVRDVRTADVHHVPSPAHLHRRGIRYSLE